MTDMLISDCFTSLLETRLASPAQTLRYIRLRDEIAIRIKSQIPGSVVRKIDSPWENVRAMPVGDKLNVLVLTQQSDGVDPMSRPSSLEALKRLKVTLSAQHAADIINGRSLIVWSLAQPSVRIFPALLVNICEIDGIPWPIYAIPDGNDGWMSVAPEAHRHYLKGAEGSSLGKFPYCIQLLKLWRSCTVPGAPISSFYLELLCATEGTFTHVSSYQQCMARALQALQKQACRPVADPLGLCAPIPCTRAPELLLLLRDLVANAAEKASKALLAEENGDHQSAWSHWNLVFNGKFPAFGMAVT